MAHLVFSGGQTLGMRRGCSAGRERSDIIPHGDVERLRLHPQILFRPEGHGELLDQRRILAHGAFL